MLDHFMLFKDKESYRLNIIMAVIFCLSLPFLLAFVNELVFKLIVLTMVVLISVLVLSKSEGLELDFENRQFRNYNKFFRARKGEWRSLQQYTSIVTLTKTGAKTASGTLMTSTIIVKQGFYELYLMDDTHLKRLFIIATTNEKELMTVKTVLKKQLNMRDKAYNPMTKRTKK